MLFCLWYELRYKLAFLRAPRKWEVHVRIKLLVYTKDAHAWRVIRSAITKIFKNYLFLYDRLCGLVARVRFPALPDFLRSKGSGTGSTQPREDNWGATLKEKK
jgi:hypothetical protein